MTNPAHTALSATSSLLAAKLNAHVESWADCQRCGLGATATNHVLGIGTLPCDILWVGEAPSNADNDSGKPFSGKSGRLLQHLIEHTKTRLRRSHKIKWNYTSAITHLISCIPTNGQASAHFKGYVYRTPLPAEANACSPRLQQFVQLAAPKGIVLIGVTTTRYARIRVEAALATISPKENWPLFLQIDHPSHINRYGSFDSPAYRNWLSSTTSFLKTVYEKNNEAKTGEAKTGEA